MKIVNNIHINVSSKKQSEEDSKIFQGKGVRQFTLNSEGVFLFMVASARTLLVPFPSGK